MPGPLIRPYSHYSLTLVTGRNRPEVTRTRAPSPMRSEARVRVASPVTSICKHGMESADPPCSRPPSPPSGGGERPSPGVPNLPAGAVASRRGSHAVGWPSRLPACPPCSVRGAAVAGALSLPTCRRRWHGAGSSPRARPPSPARGRQGAEGHAPGGPARARAPSRPVGRWGLALTTSCWRRPPRRRPRRRSSTTRPRWPAPRARTSSWPRSSAPPRWPRRAPRG